MARSVARGAQDALRVTFAALNADTPVSRATVVQAILDEGFDEEGAEKILNVMERMGYADIIGDGNSAEFILTDSGSQQKSLMGGEA